MTITVDLMSPARAVVVLTPSLLRRMLFGERAETRFAIRRWAGWEFDSRHVMTPQIERELIAAVRARAQASSGVQPPG